MRIIIIGAGPGGYETAVAARKRNFDVTLISAGLPGGTCLNEGCIPTKCFCHDAKVFSLLAKNIPEAQAEELRNVLLEKMVARKDGVVEQLRGGVESLLKDVELVSGIARVVDANTVHVWPTEEESAETAEHDPQFDGYKEYKADRIIIATGSHTAWLNVPGADSTPGVLSSSDMLRLREIPQRLTVIGGGVIGLEFASIFSAIGSKVTVIEYCRNILPHFDTDLAKRLKQSLSKSGVTILTGTEVTGISSSTESSSDSLFGAADSDRLVQIVTCRCGDKASAVVSDKVLMAVGRVPDTRVILGCSGIECTRRGITVDGNMQTTLPGVYAIGDVNGMMMLAHAATFQGKVALEHICNSAMESEAVVHEGESAVRLDIMPAAVFTVPEAAAVGLTEEDCKEKGIAYKALKSFYRANGKALASESSEGYCKLLVAQGGQDGFKEGQIIGCHILGEEASDLISEVAALMNFDATASRLANIIHPHPSLSEIIRNCVD